MALFKALCHDEENPISILMVTHDPDLASNADRMLLLNDGRTEASDIRSAWGLDDEDESNSVSEDPEPASEATDGGEEE
jgi:ABC-type lipoprotein export system ATPase subunit